MRQAVITYLLAASSLSLLLTSPTSAPAQTPPPPSTPAQPATATPAGFINLPVRKAVLYSSGVGYFEHEGTVEGNATLRLMFKTDQINDVLKSMVLMDLDKGQIASVTYGSNDPIERTLRSFGVDISGKPALHELLGQLRGAKVTVTTPDKVTGTILNVDSRKRVVGQPPTTITEYLLNLVTDGGIRTIPLESIMSLSFDDTKLRDELNQALTLLADARDTERKPVDVRFIGEGKRRVRVGYLVETPVWKTSYRLDLSAMDKPNGKPVLQGWSIVENTSDQDWKQVNLSLVSGRPISFVQDLYTPLYLSRPVVVPDYFTSLRPRMYDEGMAKEATQLAQLQSGDEAAKGFGRSATRSKAAMAAPSAPPGLVMADMADGRGEGRREQRASEALRLDSSGVQAAAQGASMGQLFEYAIAAPVDLNRRRSSMLPIIQGDIQVQKVSIYNQSALAKHPLQGVYLTNSTKLNMLSGPVTVFDGGAYAGDAQIDHLNPGDKRLLSYAVDLAVTVDPSESSSSVISTGKINQGVLHIVRQHTFTQTYRIKNKAQAERTLIIEQPFIANRKLTEPAKFEEKTASLYRFRVPIKADSAGEFVVKEVQPVGEAIALISHPTEALAWYASSNEISKSVRDAIAKVVQLKQELTQAEREVAKLERELKTIKDGQERLRQNLNTVGAGTPQGKRYLERLNAEEDRIEQLEGGKDKEGLIAQARKIVEDKRAALENFLKTLKIGDE